MTYFGAGAAGADVRCFMTPGWYYIKRCTQAPGELRNQYPLQYVY